MELEGLKRCFRTLEDEEISISHIVTDRHSQIKKFMKTEHPEIQHWFDCWHVAKGVFKKLEAAGKKKSSDVLSVWARSISNHIYWCAMSSGGDGQLVLEKWLSILNHVRNIHAGHGEKFPNCQHELLEDRAWIKTGSKGYTELEKVIKNRLLLTDIQKLPPAEQTSGLEAFHKVICHFAPKFVHFFHGQMEARVYLAAMHFNENSNRKQAIDTNGKPIFSVSYPKGRQGQGVAKEVKVKQTHEYVDELFDDLILRREMYDSFREAKDANKLVERPRPQPLSSTCEHSLTKLDILNNHKSRFNLDPKSD